MLWKNLAEQTFRYIFLGKNFYEPKFVHLLISRKALNPLTVTCTLAIKEWCESQNEVAVVQTSKVILGGIMGIISDKSLYSWEFKFYKLCQTWCHQPFSKQHQLAAGSSNLNGFFFFFCLFRAVTVTYGGSKARGVIRAVATGLRQSHNNVRSEPHLQPTPQLTATPDP